MHISVRSNARTAESARESLSKGLKVAFRAGTVTGMLVAGLSLLSIGIYYSILGRNSCFLKILPYIFIIGSLNNVRTSYYDILNMYKTYLDKNKF